MASASTFKRWLRPEAYPIFVATGTAVTMCCFQLTRNLFTNPEVRVLKENRTAGILDNFEEGENYAEHRLRKFVRNKSPEIMPSINKYFTESKQPARFNRGRPPPGYATFAALTYIVSVNVCSCFSDQGFSTDWNAVADALSKEGIAQTGGEWKISEVFDNEVHSCYNRPCIRDTR